MGGFDLERLERLRAVIQNDIERGEYFGAAIAVGRAGELALCEAFGCHDAKQEEKVTLDSVFPLMSISKTFTAVVVLAHVERGDFLLTTKVSEIIPEFAVNGKSAVTVSQLLSHTSGLGNDPVSGGKLSDPEAVLAQICNAPLSATPGHFNYSGETGYFILAEIMKRLDRSGRSYSEIMDDTLFRPLKMSNTAIMTTPELRPRRIPVAVVDGLTGVFSEEQILGIDAALAQGHIAPGASGVSTVQDVNRFVQMLLNKGSLEGTRILSPAMVKFASRIHTGDDIFGLLEHGYTFAGWPQLRANYGLGIQMRGPVAFQPSYHGTLASPESFGHKGAGLTCFWADPVTDVSFVCLTTGFLEEMQSIKRWQKLADIVHAAIVD